MCSHASWQRTAWILANSVHVNINAKAKCVKIIIHENVCTFFLLTLCTWFLIVFFHISSAADVSCPTLEVNNYNLTYNTSGNNEGDTATFSCKGDLVLVGESTLTCSSGSWSADVPTCRKCVRVYLYWLYPSQCTYYFLPLILRDIYTLLVLLHNYATLQVNIIIMHGKIMCIKILLLWDL